MRAFVVAAALSVILAAAPGFAQAPAAAPAPAPVPQAAPAQPPFPAGAKYAFINIQRVASESAQGKALSSRVQALNNQKVTELNDKNKALQTAQQKLESGASVLNEAARAQLEKDIDRQQTEIQRFTDDAQKEVQELQNELQAEFQQKLGPVIQQVAQERKLDILFSALDAEPSRLTANSETRWSCSTPSSLRTLDSGPGCAPDSARAVIRDPRTLRLCASASSAPISSTARSSSMSGPGGRRSSPTPT